MLGHRWKAGTPLQGIAILLTFVLSLITIRLFISNRERVPSKEWIVSSLNSYHQNGRLIDFEAWIFQQQGIGNSEKERAKEIYNHILGDAAGEVISLPNNPKSGIGTSELYRDDRLNIYFLRDNSKDDPNHIIQQVKAINNATLIHGNIIIIDYALFDNIIEAVFTTIETWSKNNPQCNAEESQSKLQEFLSDRTGKLAFSDCLNLMLNRTATNSLSIYIPLWIILHEIGHYADGDGESFSTMDQQQIIEAEKNADSFMMKVIESDPANSIGMNGILAMPIQPLMSVMIHRQFGKSFDEIASSKESFSIDIGRGTHPPIAYRSLSLEALLSQNLNQGKEDYINIYQNVLKKIEIDHDHNYLAKLIEIWRSK